MAKEIIVGVLASLITAAMMLFFSGVRDVGNSLVATGTVSLFNLTNCPDGWRSFDKANGRFLVASGKSGLDSRTFNVGEDGGSNKITLLVDNVPKLSIPTLNTIDSTSSKITSVTNATKGALVNPQVELKELGSGKPFTVTPEFIALKACEKT